MVEPFVVLVEVLKAAVPLASLGLAFWSVWYGQRRESERVERAHRLEVERARERRLLELRTQYVGEFLGEAMTLWLRKDIDRLLCFAAAAERAKLYLSDDGVKAVDELVTLYVAVQAGEKEKGEAASEFVRVGKVLKKAIHSE